MRKSLPILQAAEQVVAILKQHKIDSVVIGAVALAAHHYVRHTQDIDIGVSAALPVLQKVTESLNAAGLTAELSAPDADDPLGGVVNVSGGFGLVQIVNFGDRFPAVIQDAIRDSTLVLRPGSALKLAPLPQLVALKLYAGGLKSKADILELLRHNPAADLHDIMTTCQRYRLHGLEEIMAELARHGRNA